MIKFAIETVVYVAFMAVIFAAYFIAYGAGLS